MTFYERFIDLCEERNIAPSSIGKYTGCVSSRTTVTNWKNGARPTIKIVDAIAEFFGVSREYMLGWTDDRGATPTGVQPIPKMKKVRLLGEIACGNPIYANEEYGQFVEAPNDIEADFCLRARGDSMVGARIYDGDIVFCREQQTVDNGQIAAVMIGDEVTLKRVYIYPTEWKMILCPENNSYAPLVYIGDEARAVRILGRAVAFQSVVR